MVLVLPFLMSGCSSTSTDESPFFGQKISVIASVNEISDTANLTRGTDVNTFDTGDIIYVGRLSHIDATRQTPVAYTYNGTEFTGSLLWDYTRETLYAFKRGDGGGTLTDDYTVKSDQSVLAGEGKGLINSDLLFSTEKLHYYSSGTTAILNNFVHKVSKVVVNITCDDDALLTSCNLGGGTLYMTGSVANDGTLTAKGEQNGTIQMYHRPGTKTFEAFVIPQTTNSLVSDFITFVYDGRTYHYPLSCILTFVAGTCHTINITSLTETQSAPKLHLYDATTDHIGWVCCTDGSVYENKAVAMTLYGYSENEIIGMIGYIGTGLSCEHGVLVALQDAGTDNDRDYTSLPTGSGTNINSAWIAKDVNALSGSGITLGGWKVIDSNQWKLLMKQCSVAYVNKYGVENSLSVTSNSDAPTAFWALMKYSGGTDANELVAGGQHWTNISYPWRSDYGDKSYTCVHFTATSWVSQEEDWYGPEDGWYRGPYGNQNFAVRAVRTF